MTWARHITEQAEREAQREQRFSDRCTPSRAITPGTYAGSTTEARHKVTAHRYPILLEMAEGRPCLLLAVTSCQALNSETTVACHSNLGIHGKAKGRKADDEYSVWGCAACHEWYDRSGAPRAEKRRAFMGAHSRQVLHWRYIATDPAEPPRFQRAALWALQMLRAL